jgi:hypothetical protein
MDIDKLTIGEVKELRAMFGGSAEPVTGGPWKIGTNYLIRTVTMTLTGKLVAAHAAELVLESAAWIADTGRFADALSKGTLNEIEPMPGRVIVGRGSIVDATEWLHALPTVQK